MLDLLDGNVAGLAELEGRVAEFLGFSTVLTSVGQVYPRSLDHDVTSALVQLGAGPSSMAHTIRLMAGHELVTEGFAEGQVGSSAMPHKMNTRSCERVNGLQVVLRGYASMAAELAGAQWNEGDVFCSVVRRVALPDSFFAVDGQIETFLTVLDEFGAYPAVIGRELDRYLPFLATTKVLIAAVRAGMGREAAHHVIREHAVATALAMRERGAEPDLLERLAADDRLPLDRAALDVDDVAHRLQQEERQPRRQQRVRDRDDIRQSRQGHRRIEVVGDERTVLEEAQHDETIRDAQGQPHVAQPPPAVTLRFPSRGRLGYMLGDLSGDQVVHDRGIGQRQEVERAEPGIEDVGCDQ
jgi:hypothetical protein